MVSFWINILSTEVTDICKSASLAIRNIGKIRNYLDQPIAEKLVHAFVTSKIDFCNSLLYGLSKKQLDKLQHILNAAARINKKSQNFQHISSVLLNLHWLPVTKRIEFKILTITHKALNGMALSYICDLPQVHHPNRNLRSASRSLSLVVPIHQTQAYDARSFSVAALTLWNSLSVLTLKARKLSVSLKESSKHFLFNQF